MILEWIVRKNLGQIQIHNSLNVIVNGNFRNRG